MRSLPRQTVCDGTSSSGLLRQVLDAKRFRSVRARKRHLALFGNNLDVNIQYSISMFLTMLIRP